MTVNEKKKTLLFTDEDFKSLIRYSSPHKKNDTSDKSPFTLTKPTRGLSRDAGSSKSIIPQNRGPRIICTSRNGTLRPVRLGVRRDNTTNNTKLKRKVTNVCYRPSNDSKTYTKPCEKKLMEKKEQHERDAMMVEQETQRDERYMGIIPNENIDDTPCHVCHKLHSICYDEFPVQLRKSQSDTKLMELRKHIVNCDFSEQPIPRFQSVERNVSVDKTLNTANIVHPVANVQPLNNDNLSSLVVHFILRLILICGTLYIVFNWKTMIVGIERMQVAQTKF